MALQIIEINDLFHLQGRINSCTSQMLLQHLLPQLKTKGKLSLNIDKVIEIDTSGLLVFKQLYKHAMSNKNEFNIIGYGCKDIYNHLRYPLVA